MNKISIRATVAAVAAGAVLASGLAFASGSMHASTTKDLHDAMLGEAFAALKYQAFADAARANGNTELALLFEATAKVEREEHFAEHLKLAGVVGSDRANLADAIGGENYETTDMYVQMARRARAAGDATIAEHFAEVGKDEAGHRDAFKAALAATPSK